MLLDYHLGPRIGHATSPGRRSGLFALAIIEGLLLAAWYGPTAIAGRGEWWLRLQGISWELARPALAVALATLLIGVALGRSDLGLQGDLGGKSRRSWTALLAHLAGFGVFAWLTAGVLGGTAPASNVVAWGALGIVTLGSWVGVAPATIRGRQAGRGALALAAGTVVGTAALSVGQASGDLWHPFSRPTFWAVRALLGLVCSNPICLPDDLVIGTDSFTVRIAPQCSGYEGIGLVSVFLGVYLWCFRRDHRFPASLLLIPLGAAAMWLANAARIALLVILGTWVSPAVADGGFHSHAGWLALNAVGLGLVLVARRMRFFTAIGLLAGGPIRHGLAVAYLGPMMTLVAASMITGALSAGFDLLYPARAVAGAAALWAFRKGYTDLGWDWSWPAVAIGAGAFALWMALEPDPASTGAGAVLSGGLDGLTPRDAAAWLTFRVLGSVLVVPLAEELAFRGYLIRRLMVPDIRDDPAGRFTWVSFLGSSVLFGAMHGRWLAGTLAGMLFALALYRRGRLTDAVAAHATTNGMIGIYVLSTGSWSLWT